MTRLVLKILIAVCLVCLMITGIGFGMAQVLPHGTWDQIALVTEEVGIWRIYTLDVPRRLRLKLTDDELIHPGKLTWSHDGEQLLFEATYTGAYSIYLIPWAQQTIRRLTSEKYYSRAPSWSADGDAFVFRQSQLGGSALYVLNTLTGTKQHLIDDGDAPVWSPDGQWIAFVRETGVGDMIYVIKPDGSEVRTFEYPRVKFPSTITWSPDSRRIGYIGLDKDLHILDVISGENIDTGIEMYRSPVWSTEANTIVLFNQRGRRGTFYALDVVTGEQREIFVYNGIGTVTSFDWRPTRQS